MSELSDLTTCSRCAASIATTFAGIVREASVEVATRCYTTDRPEHVLCDACTQAHIAFLANE